MTDGLRETLDQYGYAQVVLVFETGAAAGAPPSVEDLREHFLDAAVLGSPATGGVLASVESAGLAHQAPVHLAMASLAASSPPPVRIFPRLGMALGYATREGVEALHSRPGVAKVLRAELPSLIRPVRAESSPPPVNPTWGVERLRAPELWAQGIRGHGVTVGHIDTGVAANHPALAGAVAHFSQFDLQGRQMEGVAAWDSDDHGTHTAGTILGRAVDTNAIGMAPEATLASAMVIEGGDVVGRILGGMEWVLGQGIRVFSASLGIRGQGVAFQAAMDGIRAAGVLPVIAVGNEGLNTSRYPGNYANVLSVGACDRTDAVAPFSSSQQFGARMVPDLVAPGVDVLSCVPSGFARMDGTSMATPHVAGLAALLFSAEPEASADDVERAILSSCVRPAAMDESRGNRGIPDAVRALAALRG